MSAGQHESHCRDGDDGSRGHQYLFQPEHPCVLGGTKVVADGRLQGIHHTKEHGTDKGVNVHDNGKSGDSHCTRKSQQHRIHDNHGDRCRNI